MEISRDVLCGVLNVNTFQREHYVQQFLSTVLRPEVASLKLVAEGFRVKRQVTLFLSKMMDEEGRVSEWCVRRLHR